jgi:hypothetical protein
MSAFPVVVVIAEWLLLGGYCWVVIAEWLLLSGYGSAVIAQLLIRLP